MRGKGVPQRMRRQAIRGNTRLQRMTLDEPPERLSRQRTAPCGKEYRVGLGAVGKLGSRASEIALEPIDRLFTERHQPLLASLAEHAHDAHVEAYLGELETDQLGHAQAGGVQR